MKKYIQIEDEHIVAIHNENEVTEEIIKKSKLIKCEDDNVDYSYQYINGKFVAPTFSLESTKLTLKNSLFKLLPKKVIEAKKQIIKKPWLTDNELDIQLKLYKDKYDDAKAGLDVFEAQAYKAGVTQEEYRNLIIQKGDEFILAEKKINDLIEAVRQLLEEKIDSIKSLIDTEKVSEKIKLIDSFTIETPSEEIFKALNQ